MTEIPCWALMMRQTERSTKDAYDHLCYDCGEFTRSSHYGDGTRCKPCALYCPECDNYKPDENNSTTYLALYHWVLKPKPCTCEVDA